MKETGILPKGGGKCFICKKECLPLYYFHKECKEKWMNDARH